MSASEQSSVVILGGGVAGLTTALELLSCFPKARITIVAKHFPGDVAPTEYCSPQAGANWFSFEPEYNRYASYDKVAFERFLRIAEDSPESGIQRFPMRLVYGPEVDQGKKFWFEDLVGGIRQSDPDELPEAAAWGVDLSTFMINVRVYLFW